MDTFDFSLLSYDKGSINDNDFLLLCRSYISLNFNRFASQLLLEPPVIPTTKQNNTDKKLDFSTGRVFVQCDKSRNTKLSILIKYILRVIPCKARFKRRILRAPNRIAKLTACKMRRLNQLNATHFNSMRVSRIFD